MKVTKVLLNFAVCANGAFALAISNGTAINPSIDSEVANPAVADAFVVGSSLTKLFVDNPRADNTGSPILTVTTTATYVVTPLPSREAKKQEIAFTRAQNRPNAVASQVEQAFQEQGKVAPSALVPAQPKQTEVKHSGLENILEIVGATDYSPNVQASPENGEMYIKFWNGTNANVSDEYAKEYNARLPHTIFNPSSKGACIIGHAADTQGPISIAFSLNNTRTSMLYLGPNSTVQIGNFLPEDAHRYNGRIQAQFGCDKGCKHCAGEGEGPVLTLFEFYHQKNAMGEKVFSHYNPSNVDGTNLNFNITVFNEEGVCRNRQCNVTVSDLEKICPKSHQWSDKGFYGCKSDCKITGRDDHCCSGAFGTPDVCPPSSSFLHELCSDAYSWPYDDREHSDTCDGTSKVHMTFYPIMEE
ncbi:hypothetical protein EG329_002025 [Mollisiaceae sp. DMI_Dod_QoI]|nr:hypothetical protein EG329_002025 [Helotiales sp. DMI_Dod_QoI]